MSEGQCFVCGKTVAESELIGGHGIPHEIETLIRKNHPGWSDNEHLCWDDYSTFRNRYVQSLIEEESGKIHKLEHTVLQSIRENELVSRNLNTATEEKLKLGDFVADRVAAFGGSWSFIIIFFVALFGWIAVNSVLFFLKPFDPYPFILMNLILSCLAAIQAPIIMMSQNRQEKKDRLRAENDYQVNLKSEIEIRTLHEKVDHLLLDQWSRMMKIQQIQIELLEELKRKK